MWNRIIDKFFAFDNGFVPRGMNILLMVLYIELEILLKNNLFLHF